MIKNGSKKILVSAVIAVIMLGSFGLSGCSSDRLFEPEPEAIASALETALELSSFIIEGEEGLAAIVEYIELEDAYTVSIFMHHEKDLVDWKSNSDQEAMSAWYEFEEGIFSLNQSLQSIINSLENGNSKLIFNIYSEENPDTVLWTIVDGETTYSAVK